MPEPAPASRTYLLLRRAGLLDEIAWSLARLPHCTPDYVRAHIALLRLRREGLNHLIQRLRSAAPAPPGSACTSRPALNLDQPAAMEWEI